MHTTLSPELKTHSSRARDRGLVERIVRNADHTGIRRSPACFDDDTLMERQPAAAAAVITRCIGHFQVWVRTSEGRGGGGVALVQTGEALQRRGFEARLGENP